MSLRSFVRFLGTTAWGGAVLVVAVALILRLAFAVWYVGVNEVKHASVPWFPEGLPTHRILDPDGYTRRALEMISGEPYRETGRQPLVPAYHALILLVFGEHPTLLYNRLTDAVMSALTCGVFYLLARRMFGQTTGLVAGLLAATSINMIHKSGYIYSEALGIPLYTLALHFFVAFADDRRWRQLVLGGAFLGLATLARQTTYPMMFLLPIWLWVVYGKINRPMLVRSAVVFLLAAGIILPWAVHISLANKRFMPVSDTPWKLLCECYGPAQFSGPLGNPRGTWVPRESCGLFTEEEVAELERMGLEREDVFKRRFLEYLPTMWTRIPELMLCRAIVFIGPTARPGLSVHVFEAQQTVLFALFVGGLWVSRAQWRRFFILYLAYFCFGVLMILVFYGNARNRLYSDPMIMVFAAAYLVWLVEKLRSRRLRKRERAASPQGAS